jgi:AraC-like DNA-binding protein
MIYKKADYKHVAHKSPSFDFHLHDGCEIYYRISGDVRYFVEKQIYSVDTYDVFITNQNEIHKPNFESGKPYERITLCIDPDFFSQFSNENYDLLKCFYGRENGIGNKITLTKPELESMMSIFKVIEEAFTKDASYCDIIINSKIIELLIILNEASKRKTNELQNNQLSENLAKITDYIDTHLSDDLSLATLERALYLSASHMCRIFKRSTNSTIHQYIIKKRIALAKSLLALGYSVSEVSHRSGFSDFSNFIKTFKKHTGIIPSKYKHYCN